MAADFRRTMARDGSVGAGNFLHCFADQCADRDLVLLETDTNMVVGRKDYGKRLSVTGFRDITERLAGALFRRGIRPRQLVAVFLADGPLYYLYYIALNRLGAIPVHLNSNMPGAVAADYLRKVGFPAIVTDEEHELRLRPHAAAMGEGGPFIATETIELTDGAPEHEPYRHANDDIVLIAHTSGTTGTPKAVQFSHFGFFFGVRQQMFHPLGRKILSALPHSHGAAITMLMSTVIRGVPLFAQTAKDRESILQTIEHWRPNMVTAFPKPLVDLCRVDLDQRDLASVSCWISTGDASHKPHIRRLVACGNRIHGAGERRGSLYIDNLGSSEFAFGILRNIHSPETNRYERCIGTPFEWVDVEIFGEDGQPVGRNTVGRLGVKSPSVTSGYWNDRATTEKSILHGYWLTGDLVSRSDDGLYYHLDRTPDKALVADRVLYSCQLEELLLEHVEEIFDCTVVGVETGATLFIGVEPVKPDCELTPLRERIRSVLGSQGITVAAEVELVPSDWNDGLTGKKLKRVIRARTRSC